MATPSTIRVELVWQLSALDWAINVLHYTTGVPGPLLGDDVTQMGTDIGASFTASQARLQYPASVVLHRIRARDIRTDGNGVLESPIGLAGTGGGNVLPAQTCLVSTIRSTLVSRRGRGRIYWPAMSTVTLGSSGQAIPGVATQMSLFVTQLMSITAGSNGNVQLAVLSRSDNTARTVVSVSTNTIFDVQTRRRDLSVT
jgi:hypothetical protein